MCLKLSKEDFTSLAEAKKYVADAPVTKKAITVYKVLDFSVIGDRIDLFAPYQGTTYTLGELKTVPKFSIDNAYKYGKDYIIKIAKGIHVCKTKAGAKRLMGDFSGEYIILECKIPKGTHYLEGKNEYACLALRLPKTIKIPRHIATEIRKYKALKQK